MPYQIDHLRVVVETTKRLLTKEQMDKKAGNPPLVHSCKLVNVAPKIKTKLKGVKRKCPLVL